MQSPGANARRPPHTVDAPHPPAHNPPTPPGGDVTHDAPPRPRRLAIAAASAFIPLAIIAILIARRHASPGTPAGPLAVATTGPSANYVRAVVVRNNRFEIGRTNAYGAPAG